MNFSLKNLQTKIDLEENNKNIEEKLIVFKPQNRNVCEDIPCFETISNNNNISPYYSNVIERQYSHSPNHGTLLHEFVDDKKIAYKDITNRIDIDELNAKIKNIIVNKQRFKSIDKIKVNHNNNPLIYHRKSKSITSFNKENKNTYSPLNIISRNNNNYLNEIKQNHNTFSNNVILSSNMDSKFSSEYKTFENNKYDNKTLKEYLNEQVNTIKSKRYKIESYKSAINEIGHNYSMDSENKEIPIKNEYILDEKDNLSIKLNKRNKSTKNIKNKSKIANILINNNKSKTNIKVQITDYKDKKISNYLSYRKNNLKVNKINKNLNNIFRNSYKSITISKNKTIDFTNKKNNNIIKTKNIPGVNNKLNNFLMPKPVKVNTKKTKNKKSYDINKNCKSFSNRMNSQDNNKESVENIENRNTLNTLRVNSKNQKQKKDKNNNEIVKYKEKMSNKNVKRKDYSEAIRNKNYSSHKNIKVKNEKLKK